MARTQAADYETRRLAIVEKAADLYADRGYYGASLSDLATACQTSKSLIYHYFSSKEDILFEVMDSHIRALADAARTVAALDEPAAGKLKTLTHMFMALYVGAASRQRVLLNELGRLPEDKREIVVGRQRELIGLVEALFVELRPALAASPLRTPTAMLYFGMINWTHTWFRPGGAVTPEDLAGTAWKLVLEGLPGVAR